MENVTIEDLWAGFNFAPNDSQRAAILHTSGALFLTAGPGSGKTRVLLWRTLNLIVFHNIKPEEIFLSTFTEKAAFQLKEGLRTLLGLATNHTSMPYDISKMYVGTVHSLCQQMISDRRFSRDRRRASSPVLLDALSQYFHLYHPRSWQSLMSAAGIPDVESVNRFFGNLYQGQPSSSRYQAVTSCIQLFNRFSEECIYPATAKLRTTDEELKPLIEMYGCYLDSLAPEGKPSQVDFSLLQQKALETLEEAPEPGNVFKHIIIDEYQDTNTIQELLFFTLAGGYGNICVVGDDDQALYRFRGATVENFVQFPERCDHYLNTEPTIIALNINYRSRQEIVGFYNSFIERCDWRREDRSGHYRIVDKNITAHNEDARTSVIASTNASSLDVCTEIAALTRSLIDTGKVQDPNQIAFLFPSLKSTQVPRMKGALEEQGILVYAPRAGRFLEVEEAVALFGIFLTIFGKPAKGDYSSRGYDQFHEWIDDCLVVAKGILKRDVQLARYVRERQDEIEIKLDDYKILTKIAEENGWALSDIYDIDQMKRKLYAAPGLSAVAKKQLSNSYFEKIIKRRIGEGKPFALGYIINSSTSFDWSVLDLFYRVTGFDHFKVMFDLAEAGTDEGPICNLSLITQYLARFMDEYSPMLTASFLSEGKFKRSFFLSYLYAIFRRDESEYEDANDPFPKGRIPFLTIHQSKGLEFPIVVLGSPRKNDKGPQFVETVVRQLIDREGEPLERSAEFDIMRMFYVALSRAKNLLVIAHPRGQGISTHKHFASMLDKSFPRIPTLDLGTVPVAQIDEEDTPKSYSYTSDYLLFQKCPRQYMIFRKYGFVASRSQTQFFGSLVHQTIEDLHHLAISQREKAQPVMV